MLGWYPPLFPIFLRCNQFTSRMMTLFVYAVYPPPNVNGKNTCTRGRDSVVVHLRIRSAFGTVQNIQSHGVLLSLNIEEYF